MLNAESMTPDELKDQLPHTLERTQFSSLGSRYEGKVRDVYNRGDHLIIITTDRVSAFDRILGTIPFKGEILNHIASAGFAATQDIVPNHLLDEPDPNVVIAKKCRTYPVEWIMRGYITGSLWRDFEAGRAESNYDLKLSTHLRRDERLEHPILTPSTKASSGNHDVPTSRQAILASGIMTEAEFDHAEETVRALFARGQSQAETRGLILVDTKYELGVDSHGQLTLVDEVHTPDSSRYWVASEYASRFEAQEPQRMLDKENLRQWLMQKHHFSGEGPTPELTEDIRISLGLRYQEIYRQLLGEDLESKIGPVETRIKAQLTKAGLLPP